MAVYFATKACVLSFTEALAEELDDTGLTVTVLCPGPTITNFGNVARGQKARHLKTSKMTAEAVARYGHGAFRKGKLVAIPGWRNRFLVILVRIIPRWLVRKIVKFYTRTKE
jgi:short-subunit dehydrogenase